MAKLIYYFSAAAFWLALVFASQASAESNTLFDVAPVSDRDLGRIVGTGAPFQQLSWRQFSVVSDMQARSDFRAFGTLGRLQMDVWWGTIGSELIAQSVRAER